MSIKPGIVRGKPNWTLPNPVTVPVDAHWLVSFFWRKCIQLEVNFTSLCREIGIKRGTISNWRTGTVPTVDNMEKALNAVGYTLIPVPIEYKAHLMARATKKGNVE